MESKLDVVSVTILPDGRMDRKNAAKYLGMSEKTLAMHACRGTGPRFIKRGRAFYFQVELDRWVREGDLPEQVGTAKRA
jgi:hypothetical protein